MRGNQSELLVVRAAESSGSEGVALKGVGGREDLRAGLKDKGGAEVKLTKEGGLLGLVDMLEFWRFIGN